jgi:hypothetical protein
MFAERRGTGDLQMLLNVGYPAEVQDGVRDPVNPEPDSDILRQSAGDRKNKQL